MPSDPLLLLEGPDFHCRPRAGDLCCCLVHRAEPGVVRPAEVQNAAGGLRASPGAGLPPLTDGCVVRRSPGLGGLNKSPGGGENAVLPQARVLGSPGGTASKDMFALAFIGLVLGTPH